MSYRLEGPVELDDKGVFMVEQLENVPFTHYRLQFFFFENSALFHNFEGIESTRVFFSCKDHSTEATSAYDLNLFEVITTYFIYRSLVLTKFYQ